MRGGQKCCAPLIPMICAFHVRYWHLADMPVAPHMSAIGGKADMARTSRNARFWGYRQVALPNSTAIFVVFFLNKGAKICPAQSDGK